MLVLSRKVNEQIVIYEDASIVITLLEIRGDKIRLGITAPREVGIFRLELTDRETQQRVAEMMSRRGGRRNQGGHGQFKLLPGSADPPSDPPPLVMEN